ncbi:SMI1/KNR4 family protein [Nocardiopsis trehalosi]|jgi:hypothetical protein|uniref:SMI1/KNR4 family protein n=1 Tax=Nocardiopsis trehalosi TaxID=109329 RepID=UPI0009FD5F32|nr:SMI1/KNR4 family protein [Nocardiopsis trehalosi]
MSDDGPDPLGTRPATPEEWRAYLYAYGDTYIRTANEYQVITAEQEETRWMGGEPATEAALAAAEDRLGTRLPPSLRAFLRASDGWSGVGGWIEEIHPCARLEWMRDEGNGAFLIELYRGEDDDDDEGAEEYVALFMRALVVAAGEDYWLLDPARVGPDGEWRAYLFKPKYGDSQEFADFTALVHDSHRTMVHLGGGA